MARPGQSAIVGQTGKQKGVDDRKRREVGFPSPWGGNQRSTTHLKAREKMKVKVNRQTATGSGEV